MFKDTYQVSEMSMNILNTLQKNWIIQQGRKGARELFSASTQRLITQFDGSPSSKC